ncbi:MAG: asparagine synthase (glutamine-hydrolyzing) [Candidatus Melainabacteria bacterium HGW-Melainabacteria-1]|nr:MAG: asparagine synthase (glutamine-hydrolyzing) [Candidatus Melainabacteria bacterium HGW-Melainabacteria-1]
MCGILACLSYQAPIPVSQLQVGLSELASRGPDGQGLWQSENGLVGLGHTRLAIRDLQHGQQPLHSADSRLHAVVNGELYHGQRLRPELAAWGWRFQTESDSELALALYARDGLNFVKGLHGEFALIIWDEQRMQLIAVRDRFGIKPLCYTHGPAGLMLASKARALLAMGHPANWDLATLQQSFALQYPLPQQTLFAGIRQLPPGHLLIADRTGRIEIRPYWDLDYPAATEANLKPDQARERLATGLRAAVSQRLAADVPVCSHLSGGIDSSTVLALMSELSGGPVDAFTVSFPNTGQHGSSDYDELGLARATAQALGARLHPVEVSCEQIIAHWPEAVRLGEGLSINGHTVAKYLLNRAIRAAGFKVALTGEGADELLLGYAHFRQDLGLSANNPLVTGLHTARGEVSGLDTLNLLGSVPSWLQAKAEQGQRLGQLLTAGAGIKAAASALLSAFNAEQLRTLHPLHRSATLWTRLALANYILPTVGDGAEMAHGVEGRLPFLDHELFESLRSLPPQAHFSASLEKILLREAFGNQLIPALRSRSKHPFLAPPLSAEAKWRSFVADSLIDLPDLPLVDTPAVLRLLQQLPDLPAAEQRAWDPVLNQLLSAAWLQAGCKLGA